MKNYAWLLLLITTVICKAQKSCQQVCGSSFVVNSTENDNAACNCCYYDHVRLESLTARRWWRNTRAVQKRRHAWFRKRRINGPIFGQTDRIVAGVLYTFSARTLKMTVFFPPLYPSESRAASVVVTGNASGRTRTAPCIIKEHTWHCLARLDNLPHKEAYSFRVIYRPNPNIAADDLVYTYDGLVPRQDRYPRIAAMGCFGKDNTKNKSKLVSAVASERPDILVLQGDQIYGADNLGYGATELVYSIHELTRVMPTIVQMDDHDYGQGNLWGADNYGEMSGAGFTKPPCIVNALQELSLGHLPDSVSKMTLRNGIAVYYTNYRYGRVDFAILEARKFKSYKKGTSLLGEYQEEWLRDWCDTNQHRLRIVLAQTPFAALATNVSGNKRGVIQVGTPMDTNAMPIEGRQRFMEIVENCSPLILSGDQHLGLAVTYEDYGVSEFASPAVINDVFWRLNYQTVGESYLDPFGHQYRLLGAWNVDDSVLRKYSKPVKSRFASNAIKRKRADGFMMVDLNGQTATCEMHSYRVQHEIVWTAEVSCVSPVSNQKGFCFDACLQSKGNKSVCNNSLACSACGDDDSRDVCNSLCQRCKAGSPVFDDLSCDCLEYNTV